MRRLIAVAVDGERSTVSLEDTLDVGEDAYEIVQVVPDSGDGDGPDGWVSIRER